MITRPNRVSSGPSRMNEERIFMAASSGTKSQSPLPALICSASSLTGRTSKPMSAIVSRMIATSLILRDVVQDDGVVGEGGGRHQLEHRVLGARNSHLAAQWRPPGHDELLHCVLKSSGPPPAFAM